MERDDHEILKPRGCPRATAGAGSTTSIGASRTSCTPAAWREGPAPGGSTATGTTTGPATGPPCLPSDPSARSFRGNLFVTSSEDEIASPPLMSGEIEEEEEELPPRGFVDPRAVAEGDIG